MDSQPCMDKFPFSAASGGHRRTMHADLYICSHQTSKPYQNKSETLPSIFGFGRALLLEKEIALAPFYFSQAARLLMHAEMGQLGELVPEFVYNVRNM